MGGVHRKESGVLERREHVMHTRFTDYKGYEKWCNEIAGKVLKLLADEGVSLGDTQKIMGVLSSHFTHSDMFYLRETVLRILQISPKCGKSKLNVTPAALRRQGVSDSLKTCASRQQ
jgi:hypothetical protein